MNDHSDQQQLLHDVLSESSPPDFRATSLAATLRQARRRRHWRQTRRAAAALCVVLLGIWLTLSNRPGNLSSVVQPPAKVPAIIFHPSPYNLVETRPLPFHVLVTTAQFTGIKTISSAFAVTQIASNGNGFRFINDDQLLALVGPGAAMLVRTGPDSEELVFANTETPADGQPAN